MNSKTSPHVVHVLPGLSVGGAEIDLIAKCPLLRDVHGYAQTVVCLRRRGALAPELESRGVRVLGPLMRGRWDLTGPLRLRRVLLDTAPSILHTHLLPATVAVDAARRWSAGLRAVPWLVSDHAMPRRWSWPSRLANRAACRRADRLCLPAQTMVEEYRSAGFDVTRAVVVPNAIEVDNLAAAVSSGDARARMRQELGLASDAVLVGTVCRLVAVKNVPVLIEAIVELDATLIVVGDGPERRRLEGMVARLGLGARVRLLGERRDVPRILASLDVFALPSAAETFGIALAEALVAERPIVATAVGAIPEIVGPELSRHLVPPGDAGALRRALTRVLADPDTARARSARAGRSIRERFAPSAVAAALADLYDEVLASPSRRAG